MQLKELFYDSGLLAKFPDFNQKPLRDASPAVRAFGKKGDILEWHMVKP